MATRDEMAVSFGTQSAAYEAGRPSYPDEAVARLLAPVEALDAPVIVDVGAGTGKLTRSLIGVGRTVIAVDPDTEMLAALANASPTVTTHQGRAEALPLDDASADLVVAAQTWHWVDPVAATAEVARVLRPGGAIGLIWNIRDESVDWVAEMSVIMHHSAAEQMIAADNVVVGAPLRPLEHETWRWRRSMTREALEQMVASRSYVITAESATRADIDARLGKLFDSLPELADGGTIELPYVTHTFVAMRP